MANLCYSFNMKVLQFFKSSNIQTNNIFTLIWDIGIKFRRWYCLISISIALTQLKILDEMQQSLNPLSALQFTNSMMHLISKCNHREDYWTDHEINGWIYSLNHVRNMHVCHQMFVLLCRFMPLKLWTIAL